MSLFLAPADQDNDPVPNPRLEAQVVGVDDVRPWVWLWVPGLRDAQPQVNQKAELHVWNGLPDGSIHKFASVNADFSYRGFLRLDVLPGTLSVQRGYLRIADGDPLEWPRDCQKLSDLFEKRPPSVPLLKTVVRHSCLHPEELERSESLSAWLTSTPVPRPKVELGTAAGFAQALRNRPRLFDELTKLLLERRMVFLLSEHSYLQEFLQGFQTHLDKQYAQRWAHVSAHFQHEAFREIYQKCLGLFPYAALDALLASLAFGAVAGLKNEVGHWVPGVFEPSMLGHPLEFARAYLVGALEREDHWQCINAFLTFLSRAVDKTDFKGKVTVFLPFQQVEEVINGDDDARRQLWEGLGALRRELSSPHSACPQLGVVLGARSLPLHKAEVALVRYSVFQIPPLAEEEVATLVADYVGQHPSLEDLDTFDKHVGGDPRFVFLLLRCLKATMDSPVPTREPPQKESIIQQACALAMKAVTETGGHAVPDDVKALVEMWLQQASEILRLNGRALGSAQVLHAWKYPTGAYGRRQGINDIDQAWMATGLIYNQAEGEHRGSSLNSLGEFPAYQFSPAGTLPYEMAERALVRARSVVS